MTPICSIRWMGVGPKMQLHLTLSGGEPHKIEMGQGLRWLFFLQPEDPPIESTYLLLATGRNVHSGML